MRVIRRSIPIVVSVLAACLQEPGRAMTVEEAYAAIPHHRGVSDPSIAKMADEEAAYLKQLFEVIDLSVRERVKTVTWLESNGAAGDSADDYDELLQRLRTLHAPQRLATVHRLVFEAIQEHRDVLRQWRMSLASPGQPLPMNHPLVLESSRKLHEAYDEVIRLFPGEDQRNRQAFYDYFCSLDFL